MLIQLNKPESAEYDFKAMIQGRKEGFERSCFLKRKREFEKRGNNDK